MIIKKTDLTYWDDYLCCSCEKKQAEIAMIGYAENNENIVLCKDCATQLARKLLEDVCDLNGDRYG